MAQCDMRQYPFSEGCADRLWGATVTEADAALRKVAGGVLLHLAHLLGHCVSLLGGGSTRRAVKSRARASS